MRPNQMARALVVLAWLSVAACNASSPTSDGQGDGAILADGGGAAMDASTAGGDASMTTQTDAALPGDAAGTAPDAATPADAALPGDAAGTPPDADAPADAALPGDAAGTTLDADAPADAALPSDAAGTGPDAGDGGGGVNALPSVALTSPATGSVLTAPADLTLTAEATDPDGAIAKVELFADGNLLATLSAAPYTFDWKAVPAGSYLLTARATDSLGGITTSAPVALVVNAPPSVALTSPATGSTVAYRASVSLTAAASDPDGTVVRVEFLIDSGGGATLLATDTTEPYAFTWTKASAGSYALTARAVDDRGGSSTSSPVTLTVSPPVARLYYAEADHLDTPRVISDGSQKVVWRWAQGEPFGDSAPDEDPDGDGTPFTLNLRFPEQYHDAETGLSYNSFRDYDPGTGRYVQADPIGLGGGMNLYAYADQSPLVRTDRLGLAPDDFKRIPKLEDPNYCNLNKRTQTECSEYEERRKKAYECAQRNRPAPAPQPPPESACDYARKYRKDLVPKLCRDLSAPTPSQREPAPSGLPPCPSGLPPIVIADMIEKNLCIGTGSSLGR